MKSTYELIRQEVKRRLDALKLHESEVVISKLPSDGEFTHTGFTLSWDVEKEGPGTNETDDIGYPCVIVFRQGTTGAWGENMDQISDARQKIRREFHNNRVYIDDDTVAPLATKVQYGSAAGAKGEVDLSADWKNRWDESMMAIVVWMRELRTS